jgi:hypothetical protein
MQIRISPELFRRIMRVVDRTPGLTFSRFCEDALEHAMKTLESKQDRPTPLRRRFKPKRRRGVGSINLVV